jgi:hypothetical protein
MHDCSSSDYPLLINRPTLLLCGNLRAHHGVGRQQSEKAQLGLTAKDEFLSILESVEPLESETVVHVLLVV